MSETPPPNENQEPAESSTPPESNLPSQSGRTNSVRFRADADVRESARAAMRMDAANQSLADALKITFRLVQAGMVVLVLLFVFSGVRIVQEGERGIRVVLGKISDGDLDPGFAIAPPNPVGEILTVGSGSLELRLETNREFFPFIANGDWNVVESSIRGGTSLDPAEHGSLITADLNIAHSQWTVNYRRADHVQYATNILPSQERAMVRVAAMRGIVHAVAATPIDDLLKDRDTVSTRARLVAQQSLDAIGSGLEIEQMTMNRKFAPAYLLEDFEKVQSAAQEAGRQRADARTLSQDIYNQIAGLATPVLVQLIDAYEAAIELGDDSEAERLLALIDAMLEGRAIEIEGEPIAETVSGEVSQILATARNDAFQIVSNARGELEYFQAQQARYDANPQLMVMREWASGMRAFHGRPFVQSFFLRDGDVAELRLNVDPDIIKEMQQQQRLFEAMQADEMRELARQRARRLADEQEAR